jgi:cyclopropane-fatty-acyl-phospholipid synthase
MFVSGIRNMIQSLLEKAGVQIGGSHPWDISILDERFYQHVLLKGSLGLGEAYMNGWWESEAPDQFITKLLQQNLEKSFGGGIRDITIRLQSLLVNMQSRKKAFQNGQHHYDIGNDLYMAMLDKRMVYTCAYWKNADNLDEAQENKLDLVCRKLALQPGQKVLDIGCGWGSFAKFAAEHYGVKAVGITVSGEQLALGKKLCAGLPVELRLQDYREVNEQFDRVVSLGMFEHTGYKNYHTYMQSVARCLKDNGLSMLHTIGGNTSVKNIDPWINAYIFPNAMLPSVRQIGKAMEGLFIMEDWQNFGLYYDRTLMAWYHNFNENWENLKNHYDERFYRMWKYYLLMCAASFRTRKNQLWQIVLSKRGLRKVFDYEASRENSSSGTIPAYQEEYLANKM